MSVGRLHSPRPPLAVGPPECASHIKAAIHHFTHHASLHASAQLQPRKHQLQHVRGCPGSFRLRDPALRRNEGRVETASTLDDTQQKTNGFSGPSKRSLPRVPLIHEQLYHFQCLSLRRHHVNLGSGPVSAFSKATDLSNTAWCCAPAALHLMLRLGSGPCSGRPSLQGILTAPDKTQSCEVYDG